MDDPSSQRAAGAWVSEKRNECEWMLDPQPQAISSWRHSTQVPELGSSEASALRWPETPAFLLKDDKPDKVLIAFLLAITALKPRITSVIFLTFPFQWTRKKAFLWSQYYSRSEMSLTWQRLDRKSMAREGHPCHPAALVFPPTAPAQGSGANSNSISVSQVGVLPQWQRIWMSPWRMLQK